MIKIGTSGYSFEDWVGPVYPQNIKKQGMLNYYEEQLGFNVVELNYTYYTLPAQKAIAGIMDKTSAGFEFAVKANKEMTHKFSGNKDVFKKFCYSLEPLSKENRLACVLAQFPYSFHCRRDNIVYLEKFRELMGETQLVVEFRNNGWHKEETLDLLRRLDLGYCIVDEPKIKGLMPFQPALTTKIAYFRFHGRNPQWYDVPTSVRYDYYYSKDELKGFIQPIKEIDKRAEKTLIFFNNCHAGSAAKNAVQLAKMLNKEFHSILSN